jgi:hypothetical protein
MVVKLICSGRIDGSARANPVLVFSSVNLKFDIKKIGLVPQISISLP